MKCPPKIRATLAALCAAAGLAALAAPVAQARFEVAIQDDPVFLYPPSFGPTISQVPLGGRDQAYVMAKRLGVDAIRFNFYWSDYKTLFGSSFANYDVAVNQALSHGIKPFFTIVGTPAYMHRCGGKMCKVDKQISFNHPNPSAYGRWVGQIARHFKGRVHMYTIWNEPNLGRFLSPPRTSPQSYRRIYQAGYNAIKRVDRGAKVFIGETTSALQKGGHLPIEFINKVASHGRLRADGFSHHPFQFDNHAPGVRDTRYQGISNFPKINAALRKLARKHRLTTPHGGVVHIYGTEFGYLACGYRPTRESRRASWGPKAFKFAKRNHALGFTWYELYRYPGECSQPKSQQPWDSGLLSMNNVPTRTYNALKAVLPHL